ncbi:MAG: hypothetical protein FJ194_07380 [Gammaproteobacteria bacterium]|nr:hypothetical protein [Gammaproteobacteria bacterium]
MLLLLGVAAMMQFVLGRPGASLLVALSFFIPVLTLLWIYLARLRAHQRNLAAFLPNEIVRPVIIIGLLVVLAPSGIEPLVTTLLVLSFFATLVAVGLMAGYAWFCGEEGVPVRTDDQHQWTRTANHFFLIAICLMGTQTIDIMVVGSILDSVATAHYAAAQRIAALAGFGVIAVNLIIAPLLPPLLQGNGGEKEAERLLRYGARLATVFVCATGGLMWLLSDLILGLFGDEFEQASGVLGILLLAQLIMAVSDSLITLMMMSGRERAALVIIGGCGLLNVLLCTVLTLAAGTTGTAFAVLLSTVLQQAGLWLLARRELGIRAGVI